MNRKEIWPKPATRKLRTRARILFVNHTAQIGGPTYSLLMLMRYLKDCWSVAVLLPESGPLCELLTGEGVNYFIVPRLQATTILKIYQLIRREAIDLIYGNNPSSCSRNAMLAAKLARKPFIWHLRGMLWHWTWRRGLFLRGADAIVAVSQSCAESLQRFCSPDKIKVVYNGVESAAFNHGDAAVQPSLARQLDLSPGAQYIISLSHLSPRKGHEQAIAIAAQLAKKQANFHLLVAGRLDRDAQYTAKIRGLIKKEGLEGRVHLLGFRTDVPQLLQGANIFLHTAKRDPHPRSVIEAMAAGLPVVAGAVDGVAETVVDGVTGYLFPPDDVKGMAQAIMSLLQAPARAAKMGQRGRERVRSHFTAGSTAAQISQIIEGLLDR